MTTSKVWEVMNDLEVVTSKICSAREIIDNAVDKIQGQEYDKAELLMSAAYEYLEYYLQEFDDKFKLAWQATVVEQKQEEDDAWDAVNKEKEYYESSWTKGNEFAKVKTYQEMIDDGWEMTADGFWIKEDKVKRWIFPIQEFKDVDTDETEYFVTFPDDFLEAADLKEGDQVEWLDNGDGSFSFKKVTEFLGMDEC